MLKIFLSSHGHFASGLKSSIDILAGNSERITVFDAYVDNSTIQENLDKFYETVGENDQVLLLSDLYGGSVNQVMFTYLTYPNTYLIAGINLALLLELAVKEEIDEEELNELIEQSRQMTQLVKLDSVSDEQADFF